MCDRENDYRVGENCRLQSFLSPHRLLLPPHKRLYVCNAKAESSSFLLCSYHLAFKSCLREVHGRWKRVKGNYVRCRDNERSILREETRMFVYRERSFFR